MVAWNDAEVVAPVSFSGSWLGASQFYVLGKSNQSNVKVIATFVFHLDTMLLLYMCDILSASINFFQHGQYLLNSLCI